MTTWPDKEEALLKEFMEALKLRTSGAPYRSVLRGFQRFVTRRARRSRLSEATIVAWLRQRSKESPIHMVVKSGHLVNAFLDWLVERRVLVCNPIAERRRKHSARSTTAVLRAMAMPRPEEALRALGPAARYGSHLGAEIREHVERMRTLGFRYDENRFLRFDRFLQQQPDAAKQTLSTLVRQYASLASSAAMKLERVKLGRVLARALNRRGIPTAAPERDRLLVQEMLRKRCRPYIYTEDEVLLLLKTARHYPSPKAPLRPLTIYTMLVLGYCAGLRMGEIVGLELKDIDLNAGTIEVRDTKFFKSRLLPLSSDAVVAVQTYMKAREKSGATGNPESALFWHEKGSYRYAVAENLLRRVIQRAGLRKIPGRGSGPRVHDLRHTFVVHRMTQWYRQGINPQSHLPYLAAYLGHRDIHSTLVYLTITQELLQRANERFRTAETEVLRVIHGD
jgi:integrase/recombinase XerD